MILLKLEWSFQIKFYIAKYNVACKNWFTSNYVTYFYFFWYFICNTSREKSMGAATPSWRFIHPFRFGHLYAVKNATVYLRSKDELTDFRKCLSFQYFDNVTLFNEVKVKEEALGWETFLDDVWNPYTIIKIKMKKRENTCHLRL